MRPQIRLNTTITRAKQISIFETLSQIVLDKFSYSISRHISNSSGIIRFPEAAFDFVRLGIGLYGIDSAETIQRKLQTTGTFKNQNLAVKKYKRWQYRWIQ
ncbi:MAG: alanine racemase [Bacteroidetes bacterium]|nr:alanine racemase [Bacteroidota bacterium]